MREVYGVPVGPLAVVLSAVLTLALAAVAALAVRKTILLKLGVRNLSRRRARTAIIVGGLMLGTMIIGAALGFGDIMATTVRSSVITSLGQTDEVVSARSADAPNIETLGQSASTRYLTVAEAAAVVSAARDSTSVDGVARAISEPVAVQDTTSRRNEPQLTLFAIDPDAMAGFGSMALESGQPTNLANLAPGQAYLNPKAADDLDARVGDKVTLFAAGRATELTVHGIVR
jgi:ABC-type lipoprotein release transport system permease subunit